MMSQMSADRYVNFVLLIRLNMLQLLSILCD